MKWVKNNGFKGDTSQRAEMGSVKMFITSTKGLKSRKVVWLFNCTSIGNATVQGVAKSAAEARAFAMKFARIFLRMYGE